MANSKQGNNGTDKKLVAASRTPRSLAAASKGIRTGRDFAEVMSALMSDLIEGTVTPSIANAMCTAGGKLLKVVELEARYGKPVKDEATGPKHLTLA